MKTYLKFINPIVAIIVLLLCLWAAVLEDGDFSLLGMVAGSFSTYFVAKGLFCSSALFILGKILEKMIAGREANSHLDVTNGEAEESETT